MVSVLARRLLQALLILLGVAVITFVLLYAMPADPARMLAGRSATTQTVANIRHELGLDQPLIIQFWHYLTGLVQGDFGRSYAQKTEVATLIWARLPATLVLMAAGIFIEVLLGLLLGVTAAVKRGSVIDNLVMMTSFVGVSAPQFVVALLLLYIFAITLGWFPMSGYGTFAHVVLPANTLGVLGAGRR
jgi:peptide/nickel transport system permease protein